MSFTLDEGSAIVRDIVPGVVKPVALIAIAEKGYVTVGLAKASRRTTPRR